ncbi:MAG TPA: NAD(P)/FAD-dependent oxidoreductase [Thermoanaerobaculia bacterium]|nr:NAD(P)/FAD-dependent oxidoreductase [Thermoanaerobaculia bacterium]
MRCDVCVIGGGPAGSTIAQRLATLGHDVCLVERQASPRPHIGATLPPSIFPLLESIGVRDRVEAVGFPRADRVIVWWADPAPMVRERRAAPGFHVDREVFDRLLVEAAASSGVRVLQPAHATRVARMGDGAWRVALCVDGAATEVHAQFVVDATGDRNILGGRRLAVAPPLFALYAEWSVDNDRAPAAVEAGEHEWFWCAPIGAKRFVAAVLMAPERLCDRESIDGMYERVLLGFRLFRPIARRIMSRVHVCDGSSRRVEELVGPGFIRVGDAAFTLDPLSSQGVLSAMASSFQAAIVVNALMNDGANTAAMEFYRNQQLARLEQYSQKTSRSYAQRAAVCGTSFWRDRGCVDNEAPAVVYETRTLETTCRIELSRGTVFESVPAIRGDMIAPTLAIRHKALDHVVAFVDEVEIAPLLRRIERGQTVESVMRSWSEKLSIDRTKAILAWLWERRVIVASEVA